MVLSCIYIYVCRVNGFKLRTSIMHVHMSDPLTSTWTRLPVIILLQGSQGPFKSLEIDFSIKGLLNPLTQPMGPFCLSGSSFHSFEFL